MWIYALHVSIGVGCEYVLHVSLSTGIPPVSVCMSVPYVYLSMKMYPDDIITLRDRRI